MGLNDSDERRQEKVASIEYPDPLEVELEAENETGAMPGLFQSMYRAVREHPTLTQEQKEGVEDLLHQMEEEVSHGQDAEEDVLIHDMRQIKRIAPDIVDVMLPGMQDYASEVRGPLRRALNRIARQEERSEGNEQG